MAFGETLQKLMKAKKITHKALGSAIGVHRTTIGDYVNGRSVPNEENFHRIHQVIPDKELYDAYFAVTKPKDRKNKPLINESVTYNYYTAENDSAEDVKDFVERAISTHEIVIRNNLEENKLIAHALVYVVAAFEEEGLQALAPNDYLAYKILVEKYKPYLN